MKNSQGKYQLYNDEMMERFLNPQNAGVVNNENAVGEVGAAACGDILRISLRIKDDKIEDAKAQIFGCGSAIASADVACDLLKGKTVNDALKISNEDVMNELGGVEEWKTNYPQKIHCSVLSHEAIIAAIENYKNNKIE